MVSQCKARKRNGKRCPNPASASGYCFTHDPARSAERSAARKRGGFNRRTAARVSGAEAVQIKDIADVLKLINAVIADVWQLENSPARGRVLLGAADTAMRALQVGELEERVKALETRLNSGNPTAQA